MARKGRARLVSNERARRKRAVRRPAHQDKYAAEKDQRAADGRGRRDG